MRTLVAHVDAAMLRRNVLALAAFGNLFAVRILDAFLSAFASASLEVCCESLLAAFLLLASLEEILTKPAKMLLLSLFVPLECPEALHALYNGL